MRVAYSGLPYQLVSKRELRNGAYVMINGPHDTYGQVTSSAPHKDGGFLNQVRGMRYDPLRTVEYEF